MRFLFTVLFALGPLFCLFSEAPLEIDAESMNYDGKTISLEGRAVVDHDLGVVEAQKVLIIPEKEGKKMRFSQLMMEKGVQITLKDGGQLNCESAQLDYHGLTGKFLGDATYKENLQGHTHVPFEVRSPELDLYLQRLSSQSIILDSAVQGTKAMQDFELESLLMGAEHSQKVKAAPIKSDYGSKDYVDLVPSTAESRIILHRITTGHPVFVTYSNDISAQADAGFYERKNEQQDTLSLKGHVEITYEGVGKLKTPQEILIHRQQKQVQLMECLGESLLDYHDDKKKESHQLTTYHKLTLDRQQNLAHLESPLDENNQVIKGLQVHLTGSMGNIYADEAFVYYQEDNHQLKPIKLLLKGNVRLMKLDSEKVVHLALADRVEYDVATQEILCLADYGKRVLFIDKANNLQVSAPAVKVKRDLKTHKESIQGIGDVRFSFIEKEKELLNSHFQEYER